MHALDGFAVPQTARTTQSPSLRRAAILVAIAFAISAFGLFATPDATFAWSEGSFDSGSEQELLALHNRARASAGRRALRWDAALGSIARSRSQDMIQRNYFDHTIKGTGRHVWDVMSDRAYCYNVAGENIGWNQHWPDGQETAEIHKSFMASPTHRDNIMGSAWDSVGIGAYKGGDGKIIWTVVFADACGATASTGTPRPATPVASKPVTRPAPPPTPSAPPRVSASLTSRPSSGRTVTWRWTAASLTRTRPACSYDVLYRDNAGPWKVLRSQTTSRVLSIAGRTPGHTYTVRVRGRDCAGSVGTWSAPKALTVR
jgi:uncharacterized protein YkwD